MIIQSIIPINQLEINEGQIQAINSAGELETLPTNPRFIRDEQFESLVKSLQDDPDMLELREVIVFPLAKKRFVVLGGNMRLLAARRLEYQEVPAKILPKDTPIEKLKRIVIKDNGSWGNHDWELLANEWSNEPLEDWGIILPLSWNKESEEDEGEETFGDPPPKKCTCPKCGHEF